MNSAVADPALIPSSPTFEEVAGDSARLTLLAEVDAHEGPVYFADEEANGANGMTADPDGNLIVCEQGSRWQPARITRVDRRTGARETPAPSTSASQAPTARCC
jgi:hypothetical protein